MLFTLVCLFIIISYAHDPKYKEDPDDPSLVYYEDFHNEGNPDKDLECQVRTLAYQYALQIQPFRGTQPDTFNALQINEYCDQDTYNNLAKTIGEKYHYRSNAPIIDNDTIFTVYVDPINGNDKSNNGTIISPYKTLEYALKQTRLQTKSNSIFKQIILRKGISFINDTINLSPSTYDNNLLIRGYPGEEAWISGGILLDTNKLEWSRYETKNKSQNIWKTNLRSLQNSLFNNSIGSLFTDTPHERLIRGRYPNGVYSFNYKGKEWINPSTVIEWWPAYGQKPKQIFKNLSCDLSEPCLNHSIEWQYNLYTAGYDGLCNLWVEQASSYWCGRYVGGGWSFEDQHMSELGIRQIPIGMTYNQTLLNRINGWKSNLSDAIIFLRHQQSWNMYMFSIGEYDQKIGNISFKYGGWQGGRVMPAASSSATNNKPIETGAFYFSGILDELDIEGEYYFDKSNGDLYYWPNNTKSGIPPNETNSNLIIGNVATLFNLSSSSDSDSLFNVTISDLSFRDTRYTYMDRWGTPSGGDWALFRGASIFLENTTNCTISNSAFINLDGNGIILSGYNRNTTISRNEFEGLGDNVMAAWGYTKDYDGTDGLQPRNSYIIENYVHDIGYFQDQSSPWFQAKSCQSYLDGNIFFNLPRAAILFNDGFGGGNQVKNSLIFNTCAATGDHGPINSWNRMPFLTKVAYGYPSFDTSYSNITNNFIIANYAGSQSFDTDDGSSWYRIYSNFFWDSQGIKNDYGGYNIYYFNNLNVCWNKGGAGACWDIGPMQYDGDTDHIYNNICIYYNSDIVYNIQTPTSLSGSTFEIYNNSYYSPNGNTSGLYQIEDGNMIQYKVIDVYKALGFEKDSTSDVIPSNQQIIQWAKNILNI